MEKVFIKEIFYSIQGEGQYAGTSQYFIRFCGCNLNCSYCDTDVSKTDVCPLEIVPGQGEYVQLKNPLSAQEIIGALEKIKTKGPHKVISLTGGEPLLQAEFLKELLPELKAKGYEVHLETNGTQVEALKKLIKYIDVIAMDLKLHLFNEPDLVLLQKDFLAAAEDKDVFIKIVLEKNSAGLEEALNIIVDSGKNIPVFFQPVSEQNISIQELLSKQRSSLEKHPNIRIIPQLHKALKIK